MSSEALSFREYNAKLRARLFDSLVRSWAGQFKDYIGWLQVLEEKEQEYGIRHHIDSKICNDLVGGTHRACYAAGHVRDIEATRDLYAHSPAGRHIYEYNQKLICDRYIQECTLGEKFLDAANNGFSAYHYLVRSHENVVSFGAAYRMINIFDSYMSGAAGIYEDRERKTDLFKSGLIEVEIWQFYHMLDKAYDVFCTEMAMQSAQLLDGRPLTERSIAGAALMVKLHRAANHTAKIQAAYVNGVSCG